MSEKSKIEIEELLSAMVDNEASERQKNEFMRLVQHDSAIADQYTAMQRQKQILGSLPFESAPASLVEDISAVLERKQILEGTSGTRPTIAGASHLFMRRVLTTAAMLLLPIGILTFVVYEIIRPPSVGPVDYLPVGGRLAQGQPPESIDPMAPAMITKLPFDGTLTFRTDQPKTVSNYAEKMIFDGGLVSVTVPNRTVDATTFQITAPPQNIEKLIDSLKSVWPHCQEVTLSVTDNAQGDRVDIHNVQVEQIKTLAIEENRGMLNRLAGQYALANDKKDRAFAAAEESKESEIDLLDSLPLPIPIPTGKNEPNVKSIDPLLPTVRLQISIERTAE